MIRDPSDGSVKEKSAPEVHSSLPLGESGLAVTPDCAGADTGLQSVDATELERLKRSREWLQDWKAKRGNGE